MNKFLNKKIGCVIATSLIVLGLVVGGNLVKSFKSKASDKDMTAKERLQACREEEQSKLYGNHDSYSKESEVNLDERVRAIVTLEEESVADTSDVSRYTSKLKSKENKVIKEQKDIIKEVEKLTGKKVVNQTGYLVNSFSIDATIREMKAIAKIDGVKSVTKAVTYKTSMETAIIQGNVDTQLEAAEYGYTGEGVVIAVIDTGVNYEHQDMALDSGVKTKYTEKEWKDKIELLGYGKYMSEKVPFGYNYVTGENSCSNPVGEHGYHVSSIAAANGKIDGVAKNAQVLGLNVFGKQGYATSDDIVAAIEDAVKLGADIINLSLGCDISVVSNDYEQIAIDNASKEGVICCIAAGNSATSSSDSGPKNLLNVKDTAMVGSLAVVDSSLAVASADNMGVMHPYAEELGKEKEVKMSKFSSWGPTNELGIKPEITAPGGDIKAACQYEDEYQVMSGTSMASPYIAGSQAVMLNAIKARGVELKGSELVSFMKNSLMNTADVIIDKTTNNPYSIRYQGAGLVDVYGAVDNDVIVTYNDKAKVELGEFEGNRTFEIVIKNYGKEICTYRLNNTQIYVDYTDDTKWRYGITPVEGATITYSMNDVVVGPGASVKVKATVNIPENYEYNSYVEAFIQLEGQACQNIGLPVLGFYGDWDNEPIIDKSLYDTEKSVINTYLTYEKEKIGSYLALINEDSVEKAGLGIGKVEHKLSDIESNNEVIVAEPSKNFNLVHLEENVECDVEHKDKIAEYSIKVSEDGYYTFELSDISVSEITIKQAYDKKHGDYDNIIEMKGMGDITREVMLLKGREYRVKLHLLKKGIFDMKQGKIRYYKSSGENAFTTEKIYDSNLASFSPNGDNVNDKVSPSLVMLRCAKEVKVNVLDSDKNLIRTLAKSKDVAKTTFRLDGYAFDGLVGRPHESLVYNNIENTSAAWDGKLYNKQIGKYEYVDEGIYYIQVIAKRTDDSIPCVLDMPIRIDNVEPQVKEFNVSKIEGDTVVEFYPDDNHSLKGNYYIDIEEKTKKGTATYTYARTYLETDKNDKGNYVLNLGTTEVSKITLLVEDMAGNQVYKKYETSSDEGVTNIDVDMTEKKDSNLSEDIDNNTGKDTEIDSMDVNIVEGSYVLKSQPYSYEDNENKQEEIVLVDKKENGDYIFEFKVSGCNDADIEELLDISADSFTSEDKYGPMRVRFNVNYEGNDTFFVEMKAVRGVTKLCVEWQSNTGNYCSKIFNLTTSKIIYKEMCDADIVDINYNMEEIRTVDSTMLNEDGTYSLTGKIHAVPDKLSVNGQEVVVNPETFEFACDVPIKKGRNYIGIVATIDGIEYFRGNKVTYEDINISLADSISKVDGVIHTDNEIFNLEGVITSYASVLWIEIDGDKVYTASDYLLSTDGKVFEKKFDYTIKLAKGVNKIRLVVKTSAFVTEEKIITVDYK